MFRLLALPFAALVAVVGIAPTATAAPAAEPSSTLSSEATTSAERLLISGWRIYEKGYHSAGSCDNSRRYLHNIYAGYWIGGWHSSRCARYAIPSCGATTYKYQIEVRSYYSQNGPFSVSRVDSTSTPVALAC